MEEGCESHSGAWDCQGLTDSFLVPGKGSLKYEGDDLAFFSIAFNINFNMIFSSCCCVSVIQPHLSEATINS